MGNSISELQYEYVSECRDNKNNYCRFKDNECWYKHNDIESLKTKSPEIVETLFKMMEKFAERMAYLESQI